MCLPVFAGIGVAMGAAAGSTTAAAVGTAVVATTLAGIGMSAFSAISSAKSQQDAAKYNAKVNDMAARDAVMRGNIRAQEIRDKARMMESNQVAQFAASGLNPNFGTPSDIISETQTYGELDALKAINNAQRQKWSLDSDSELELFNGRKAMQRGYMDAGASLLSSASNVYSLMR